MKVVKNLLKLLVITLLLEESFAQVTLSPGGETTLACVSGSVQFMCTAPLSVVWTTTGFQDDATNVNEVSGQTAQAESPRIETSDQIPTVSTSSITIRNFTYSDQNATVVCLNGNNPDERTQTRIVIDTTLSPNPSSITILNATSADNGARIQCNIVNGESSEVITLTIRPPNCTEVIIESTTLTSITVSWTTPAPALSYRIRACLEGTSDCPVQTNCTGCSSYEATGLSRNTSYTITVDSSFSLANGDCFSQGCSANTVTTKTVAKCPDCLPCDDSASQGVIAGVAVGCLSLSLLFSAATNVITFLCTRRCYNKKSSPPSHNEKSVYYETVQSDSVPMQPSPAYQSVEQVK